MAYTMSMDTKPSPDRDPTEVFIRQCEALRVGVSLKAMGRESRAFYFGKGAAIQVLYAIGRYLHEHPEVEDPK